MTFGWILFITACLLQSGAQILQKYGVTHAVKVVSFGDYFTRSSFVSMASNPFLLAGVLASVLGMICWLGALSQFKVSYMFTLGSMTYIIVALLSWWILSESISVTRWIGIFVIIAGCVVLSL